MTLRSAHFTATLVSGGLLALAGCGDGKKSADLPPPTPAVFDVDGMELADPELVAGREVWKENCKFCHLKGRDGAPRIGDKAAWAPRIEQGEEVLLAHAIAGLIGPDGEEMPARGGNEKLTDDQMKQAVSFVVAASR